MAAVLCFKINGEEVYQLPLKEATLREVQAKKEDLSREHGVEKGEIEVTIEDRGEWILTVMT